MANPKVHSDHISGQLIRYLRAELKDESINYDEPLKQVEGGFETSTYRFKLSGAADKLSEPLILRLYPPYIGTANAVRESTVQNALAAEGYPIAKVYFVCTDISVLGGACIIMEHLPGQSLMAAALEVMPGLLANAHASLHRIDPGFLIKALSKNGIDEYQCSLDRQYDSLSGKAAKLSWIREITDWVIECRPGAPELPAVCHGDFHPGNILFDGRRITGVLDWPNFAIADPAYDVANTAMLFKFQGKYMADLRHDFTVSAVDRIRELYLAAYKTQRPLESTCLEYYQIKRCVEALVQGYEGQEVWQHPSIRKDMIEYIRESTGIRVNTPAD